MCFQYLWWYICLCDSLKEIYRIKEAMAFCQQKQFDQSMDHYDNEGLRIARQKKHVPPIVARIVWLIAHALKMCNWGIEREVEGGGLRGGLGDRWSRYRLAWLRRWSILSSTLHASKWNEKRSARLLSLLKHEMKEPSDSAADNPAWSAHVREQLPLTTCVGEQQSGEKCSRLCPC